MVRYYEFPKAEEWGWQAKKHQKAKKYHRYAYPKAPDVKSGGKGNDFPYYFDI